MTITPRAARQLYWVGIGLMLLAILLVGATWVFEIRLNSLHWLPLALGGSGMVLTWVARLWPSVEEPEADDEPDWRDGLPDDSHDDQADISRRDR